PLPALGSNYTVGLLAVIAAVALRTGGASILSKAVDTPWWSWLGGLSGAFYGLSVVFFATELGAAALASLAVSGQLICSVVLDHYAWLGFDVHPVSIWRIVGCIFLVAGFTVIAEFRWRLGGHAQNLHL